VTSSSAAPSM
jgi:hypothetical protein